MNEQSTLYQLYAHWCAKIILKLSSISLEVWLSLCIAFASLLVAFFQYRKSQKLQRENLEIQKKLLKSPQQEYDHEKQKNTLHKTDEMEHQTKVQTSALQRYQAHVISKFQFIDFSGLNAILQKPIKLARIYVKLRAKPSYQLKDYISIKDFNQLTEELQPDEDNQPIDFLSVFNTRSQAQKEKQEPLKMIILGHPGSGKTTLMKWIALQCASQKPPFTNMVPVFIPLKDFGADPDNTFRKFNLLAYCTHMIHNQNLDADFFKGIFDNSQVIFLLDGLDEVAIEKTRRDVIAWIQDQHIRKNVLMVTSRFSGLQESRGLQFHSSIPSFAIQDFDIGDIEQFLENWYATIEIAVGGERSESDALDQAQKSAKDLIEVIKDKRYESLKTLAVNPLLLTIIAIVHRTRAVLPKERFKLYDESIRVMIELWNVANRRLDISFSVENSMANLSRIAAHMMIHNCREVKKETINTLLPETIEGKSRADFLDTMVIQAGLLYYSEGQFGFLHLSFQEYLTAIFFAKSEAQNDILEYCSMAYWQETIKLLMNVGHVDMFFQEIDTHLITKDYWRHMKLWEDCLNEISVEETKIKNEKRLAATILKHLPEIDKNEEMIVALSFYYPLFQYANDYIEKGWQLFHHAKHPFVQSIGSSILFRCEKKIQDQLVHEIKERISIFEKADQGDMDHFIMQNNNSLVILIARQHLLDFIFALAKIKSNNHFLAFKTMIDLIDLIDLRIDLRNLRNLRYLRDLIDWRDLRDLRDWTDLIDLIDLRDWRDLIDLIDLRNLRYLRDLRDLRDLRKAYTQKYAQVFKDNQAQLQDWINKTINTIYQLSDKDILKYFPETSQEEIMTFRCQFSEFVHQKLSDGDYSIFNYPITNAVLESASQNVDLYVETIKPILDRELDFDDDADHKDLLKLFDVYRKIDYARLREIMLHIIENERDENIRLNALYIFKRVN
jgi:energy-coupling factor transporter ATP-binding protein EcfA2